LSICREGALTKTGRAQAPVLRREVSDPSAVLGGAYSCFRAGMDAGETATIGCPLKRRGPWWKHESPRLLVAERIKRQAAGTVRTIPIAPTTLAQPQPTSPSGKILANWHENGPHPPMRPEIGASERSTSSFPHVQPPHKRPHTLQGELAIRILRPWECIV